MLTQGRLGTGLLSVGGIGLLLLMGYTLAFDPEDPAASLWFPSTARGVAVIVPERDDWMTIRQAVLACAGRGVLAIEAEDRDALTIVTPEHGRRIRLAWSRARGAAETRKQVRSLWDRPAPPFAVIGSSNTALTVALAEAMASRAGPLPDGPPLLIPWATAMKAGAPDPLAPLLGLYPGRSFRFCPNNQRQADLVVRCALDHGPRPAPARVIVVVDEADPYSIDLASAFELAVRRHVPGATVVRVAGAVSSPGLSDSPGSTERATARRVGALIAERSPAWVVLPLQNEPTRRLIAALKAEAPENAGSAEIPLLCGDGIGVETLAAVAGDARFSIWCASPDSTPTPDRGLARDLQVPAEVLAALVHAVDGNADAGPGVARRALSALDLTADDRRAVGRSVRFDPDGERLGDDLGEVLAVLPGRVDVRVFPTLADGTWAPPRVLVPDSVVRAP